MAIRTSGRADCAKDGHRHEGWLIHLRDRQKTPKWLHSRSVAFSFKFKISNLKWRRRKASHRPVIPRAVANVAELNAVSKRNNQSIVWSPLRNARASGLSIDPEHPDDYVGWRFLVSASGLPAPERRISGRQHPNCDFDQTTTRRDNQEWSRRFQVNFQIEPAAPNSRTCD